MTLGDLNTYVENAFAANGIEQVPSLGLIIEAVNKALTRLAVESTVFFHRESINPLAGTNQYPLMGSNRVTTYNVRSVKRVFDNNGDLVWRLESYAENSLNLDDAESYDLAWRVEGNTLYLYYYDAVSGSRSDATDKTITIEYYYVPGGLDSNAAPTSQLPESTHARADLIHAAIADLVFADLFSLAGREDKYLFYYQRYLDNLRMLGSTVYRG